MLERLTPLLGIITMVAICLAMSRNRRAALQRWPLIAWGLGLQFIFALLILKTGVGRAIFAWLNDVFVAVIDCTKAGASFLYGDKLTDATAGLGYFAFVVLSTIIFFSALSAILYQMGILQKVVKAIAWVMAVTMRTSGAETLSASANIFVGQTEAPLLVRPFIARMTNSELMTVMAGGFATVAGGVMAAYIFFLGEAIPNIAGHLLAASVMSAPAALLFGKLIVPEEGEPVTRGQVNLEMEKAYDGIIDAAAGGASEGVKLALNVGGMLIAFLALLALGNLILSQVGGLVMMPFSDKGFVPQDTWRLESILGYIFAPMAWLLGVPSGECVKAGELMGIKTVANEFVAYIRLQEGAADLSPRTRLILAYGLCGFANFGSIGIQIGGLSILAPERRADLAKLGLPAMIAGTLGAFCTACVAAILFDPQPIPYKYETAAAKNGVVAMTWQAEVADNVSEYEVYVWADGTERPAAPTTTATKAAADVPAAAFGLTEKVKIVVVAVEGAGKTASKSVGVAKTIPNPFVAQEAAE